MIRKIMKVMSLLALACILCFQTVVPVMAQLNISGIDPTQLGSINIHRFAGNTPTDPTGGTPLNGIPYTVERVRLRTGIEQTADNLRNPENFEPIRGDGEFSVTQSTVNGVARFTNLPQGIYLVTEGAHTVTPEEDRVAPFIVGIPRRSTDGTTWIYDVDVYPKSEEDTTLTFDKTLLLAWDPDLERLVAEIKLETIIPRLIGNATRLEFVDPLDNRLTLIPGSVGGTYLRMEENEGVLNQVESILPASAFTYVVNSDNELTITLTETGLNYLAANAVLAPQGTLTFTFRSSVSDVEVDLGEIDNEATLYYNDNSGILATADSVTQFAIEVEKVDVNGNRLSEATFQLFLDPDGNNPAFPNTTGVNREFITTGGIGFIPALQAGTFYLQETEAPEGFRLITTLMPVTVSPNHVASGRNHVIAVQVVNEVEGGFVLPETGGRGTVIFTVVGLALVGGAITLALVAKRRREIHD